jgi:hypothetical protein
MKRFAELLTSPCGDFQVLAECGHFDDDDRDPAHQEAPYYIRLKTVNESGTTLEVTLSYITSEDRDTKFNDVSNIIPQIWDRTFKPWVNVKSVPKNK